MDATKRINIAIDAGVSCGCAVFLALLSAKARRQLSVSIEAPWSLVPIGRELRFVRNPLDPPRRIDVAIFAPVWIRG